MRTARLYFILIISLIIFSSCQGENVGQTSERGFDQMQLDQLNARDQYNYDRVVASTKNPFLGIIVDIISGIAWLFNSVLGYIFILAIVVLLIWVIIKKGSHWRPIRDPNNSDLVNILNEEDVQQTDYQMFIKQAMQARNFQLLIRYTFLNILKELHQSSRIKWHNEKTNLQYYRELPNVFKPHFHRLIIIYEYVWYGGFEASQALYDEVNHLNKELRSLNKDNNG